MAVIRVQGGPAKTARRWVFSALAGAWWLGSVWAAGADAESRRPNFVFFLIDDLGWVDTGCYGSRFYETPSIDRLAGDGMRFTNAYAACCVCSPTRASILTGKYPARLHLTDYIPGQKKPWAMLRVPDWTPHLALEEMTIAEALKAAGYVSASIGKWHLGNEPYYPERQGFDLNFGGCSAGNPPSYFYPYAKGTRTSLNIATGKEGEYLTDRLTHEAEQFLENNRDRPFFLYFPHYAVHTPLEAKKEKIEKYKAKAKPDAGQKNPTYAAMIESVDESVGRILKKLDELGIAGQTVVFFMSDNGGVARITSNAPLRAGKGTLYEGGIREPLIVRWPGVVEPGSVCETAVISVDFYPTILAMAGLEPAAGQTVDGVSLVPLLRQIGGVQRDAVYWHYPHYHETKPCGAIRQGDYKLIEYYEDGRLELYNLRADIGEQNNLAESTPEKAAELRGRLEEWRQSVGAQMPTPNPDYDPKRANPKPPAKKQKAQR